MVNIGETLLTHLAPQSGFPWREFFYGSAKPSQAYFLNQIGYVDVVSLFSSTSKVIQFTLEISEQLNKDYLLRNASQILSYLYSHQDLLPTLFSMTNQLKNEFPEVQLELFLDQDFTPPLLNIYCRLTEYPDMFLDKLAIWDEQLSMAGGHILITTDFAPPLEDV